MTHPPDHSAQRAPSSSSLSPGSGGGSQACAACKYQRRKCAADCPLAPHFPPNHHKEFYNAHKLFGVSNMLKIIRDVTPNHRSLAMKTIIHEANVRALDPVGGCYHVILRLQYQIKLLEAQLDLLLRQLAYFQSFPQDPHGDVMAMGLHSLIEFEQHEHEQRVHQEEEEDVVLVNRVEEVEKSCSERDAYKVFDNRSVKIEREESGYDMSPGYGNGSSQSQLLPAEDDLIEMKPSIVQKERNHISVGLH
ncbi:LOB domain-containing protein 22 [Linum perenne]